MRKGSCLPCGRPSRPLPACTRCSHAPSVFHLSRSLVDVFGQLTIPTRVINNSITELLLGASYERSLCTAWLLTREGKRLPSCRPQGRKSNPSSLPLTRPSIIILQAFNKRW